jgi:hypothetical protein
VPFAIVIRDFFVYLLVFYFVLIPSSLLDLSFFLLPSAFSREALSGRALRIPFQPGPRCRVQERILSAEDVAEPLFSYCVRLFRFLFFFWLGSLSQPGLLQPLNGPAGPLRCYRFAL